MNVKLMINDFDCKPNVRKKVGRPRLRCLDNTEMDLRFLRVRLWNKYRFSELIDRGLNPAYGSASKHITYCLARRNFQVRIWLTRQYVVL